MKNLQSTFLAIILFFSILSLASCGSDDEVTPEIEKASITSLSLKDISNNGNAADIEVTFSILGDETVSLANIFLVPSSKASQFSLDQAEALSNDKYASISVSSNSFQQTLPAGTKDIDGNNISNDVSYHIFVLLVVTDGDNYISSSKSITLKHESLLKGVWSGTGRSSLFPTNYAVTFDLDEENGKLIGKFFINNTTTAGFGGADDGTFYAEIDGTDLNEVTVTQILANLDCPGTFTGTGTITNNNKIRINWTGTDCSGFHDNGVFDLTKQ